jgi:hypothetical protein
MSKRSVRRHADRAARKAAFQAPHQQAETTQPTVETYISEAQLAANRANAQGKAKSAMNALKHGLTGKTVLLPTDDVGEYNDILNAHVNSYQPATEEELNLIQSIVDSTWRLKRCRILETGILVKGEMEVASKYEDQSPARRAQLIHVDAYLKYEKSIRNLQIQEARLHRRLEKDKGELMRLQSLRKREEQLATEAETHTVNQTVHSNGFDFSNPASQPPATPNQHPQTKEQTA